VQVESEERNVMPLWLAFLPVVMLIFALTWNVLFVYGDNALSGSSQIIIMFVAGISAAIGLARGVAWEHIQKRIVATISNAMPSILILLLVGSLASIWLLSGTVPTLVYYGLKLLNPTIFLVGCCIACALTSVMSGSSWSTAATIGVAMVAVGRALGVPDGLIGGAIISGSYFGDKISPLSDTTNLAAAVTETPVFDHIRYLLLTTGPSMIITLIIFTVIGLNIDTGGSAVDVSLELATIRETFHVSPWLLLPPIVVLTMITKRVPAIPSLFVGILVGGVCAVIFQQSLMGALAKTVAASPLLSGAMGGLFESGPTYVLVMDTLYKGVSVETSMPMLSELFSAGGMEGMLGTVWLILAAMTFGGAMDACGMLTRIMDAAKGLVKGFFSLVLSTAGTCMVTNLSTSDQYIAVAIPGRMYSDLYKEKGYASENLSRTLEDTGTVTSVLIPWNTCGAYHASVLGIGTLAYLPFCFFNLISPLMTLFYAWFMIKIKHRQPQQAAANR